MIILPKQTFYNLPSEKREKIIQNAIKEFAENLYVNASITKIAEHSGIAKGSMYQYFIDKKDLYRYLLELIGEKKLEYMQDVIANRFQLDLMTFIRMLYQGGLEFALKNPALARIANNFIKEQHSEIREEILKESQQKSNLFFSEIIEHAKKLGEIREEVSTDMVAYLIYHINNVLLDWVDLERISESKEIELQNTMHQIDKLMEILENGLKNFERR